ncbi:hypothetical protein XENTR_v10002736 [Xenopus tropicalis]|nr:hypothetical protein XENTR_v10002736 [Xenopus tropicalis]
MLHISPIHSGSSAAFERGSCHSVRGALLELPVKRPKGSPAQTGSPRRIGWRTSTVPHRLRGKKRSETLIFSASLLNAPVIVQAASLGSNVAAERKGRFGCHRTE